MDCRYCHDMGQTQTVKGFWNKELPKPCEHCNKPINLREQALSKLTKEEKEALGL